MLTNHFVCVFIVYSVSTVNDSKDMSDSVVVLKHTKVIKPTDIITGIEDVRRLSGCNNEDIYEIEKVYSRRTKVLPGMLIKNHGKAFNKSSYFLLAEGELYLCNTEGSKQVAYGNEICATFPLMWHQQEPGLEIHYNEQKKADFEISVKTLTGQEMSLAVCASNTIYDLKKKICDKDKGFKVYEQRLVFAGKQLEDSCTLSAYNIHAGVTVHLILRLRGGMYHSSSGRDQLDKLWNNCPIKQVRIKYGAEDDDELEIELKKYDTCDTLMTRANIKIEAIKALQEEIRSLKSPAKKQKTSK